MAAPLRILQVHNRYRFPGGEEQVVANEGRLLRDHGHAVELLEFQSEAIQGPLQTLKTAWHLPYNPEGARRTQAALARFKPDLMHIHNSFPLGSTAVAIEAHKAGTPVVQTLHNYRMSCLNGLFFRQGGPCTLCLGRSTLPGVRYRCYQDSLAASLAMSRMIEHQKKTHFWQSEITAFIALSDFAAANFIKAGVPPERLFRKPNFLAADAFATTPKNAAARQDFFLYVGRLSEEKGIFALLQLWRAAEGKLGALKIVGTGPDEAKVRTLAGQCQGVEVLGLQPKAGVYALMDEALALIFPSTCFENFPLAPLEAMARGLPVAAHEIGSVPEMLAQGKAGLLFAFGDELIARLRSFKESASQRDACASAALERARSLYNAEANYEALLKIYAFALGA